MCGIAGLFGPGWTHAQIEAMVEGERHRGPDAQQVYLDPGGAAVLGHARLSILDLSADGRQPMATPDGRYVIVFNGEVYNYLELRAALPEQRWRSGTDTEVVLAAYARWGAACLDRLVGMFSFIVWDTRANRLFAARDRFGVKPLYFKRIGERRLAIASEIRALEATGVRLVPDPTTWATFLASGVLEHGEATFWAGVCSLPAGHSLTWQDGALRIERWYDIAERVGAEFDGRSDEEVQEEYLALLKESIALRFRADVDVGINLSGGVDSSVLLGLVNAHCGDTRRVRAYTFVTGDAEYDELPWVTEMLARTAHESVVCRLAPGDVPSLADRTHWHQMEPYGGIPTLAYAKLFQTARAQSTHVLLDGQGMDEQWAGYDYYGTSNAGDSLVIQGARSRAVREECLLPDFCRIAEPLSAVRPFPDALRNQQYRDIRYTKIPRALRYNDRASMASSVELREPFLDHRLMELALRQPASRTIGRGERKYLLRRIADQVAPPSVSRAPKRPVQTPQREWLRGPLREWAHAKIDAALSAVGGAWIDPRSVRQNWTQFLAGEADNSFFVWQWISIGSLLDGAWRDAAAPSPSPARVASGAADERPTRSARTGAAALAAHTQEVAGD